MDVAHSRFRRTSGATRERSRSRLEHLYEKTVILEHERDHRTRSAASSSTAQVAELSARQRVAPSRVSRGLVLLSRQAFRGQQAAARKTKGVQCRYCRLKQ